MTKIVLHKHPKEVHYRAVIDHNGVGVAYRIKQYKEGEAEILEATVIQRGVKGTNTYLFSFDDTKWVTNSDPISRSPDWRTSDDT